MSKFDLDTLRSNEGSQFNSSMASLMRMHNSMMDCNFYSGSRNYQGLVNWLNALRSFERELSPYMTEEETKVVSKARVKSITRKDKLLNYYYERLDVYERELRFVHSKKGFGIKAGEGDPGRALERDMS